MAEESGAVFAEQDQHDGGEEAHAEAADCAGGVEALPEHAEHDHRQIRRGGDGEGEADEEGGVHAGPEVDGDADADRTHAEGGDACDLHFLTGAVFFAVMQHVRVKVVREAGAGAHREPGHHREDRRKGHGADEGEEELATEHLSENRSHHVGVRFAIGGEDEGFLQDRGRSEAEEGRHDVKEADDRHRPHHAGARGLGIRHGVKAHEDVRQTGGAQNEAQTERHEVQRTPRACDGHAILQAGLEQVLRLGGSSVVGFGHGLKEGGEAVVVIFEHQIAQQHGTGHEEQRLDDLHPGRREHAAKHDIHEHQHTDADHRRSEIEADQLLDDHTRAHHLGDHVEGGDCERAQRGQGTHRAGFQAIGQQIGHGVFACIAQRLRHHEQNGDVGHEEAHGIHEAVVAAEADHAGDAEEAGRAHVVTRDGEAVLPAGDAAPGGEVGAGAGVFLRCPKGDEQGERHEGEEHDERDGHGGMKRRMRKSG